jgi:hypothetical protein
MGPVLPTQLRSMESHSRYIAEPVLSSCLFRIGRLGRGKRKGPDAPAAGSSRES